MNSTLGAIADLHAGSAFPQSEQHTVNGDLTFAKVADLGRSLSDRYLDTVSATITTGQRARLNPSIAYPGETLFAKIGEGMKSERFRQAVEPTAFDNNMMAAKARPEYCNQDFLYYLLRTLRIGSTANGSALPYLTQKRLSEIEVQIPSLPEQQAIAEVLGALDDKITANRKLVATIDDLATALYKQSVGTERLLTDLASFVNGRNFTKDATGDGRVVVRIAELNSGVGGSTVRNRVDHVADDNLVRSGDILFAWSGSLTLHRWTQPEALINQHIFKVVPNDGVPYWLAYQAVKEKLPEFKSIAADKATTMGHIQRRHLDTEVAVPSPEKLSAIDPLMTSLWERAITAEEESQTLAQLRDTLLPALMDGTIRVKDAQTITEEAV